MKKIDKLKHQRYDVSMKIIALETKQQRAKLTKNEEGELEILRSKLEQLEQRITELSK